MIPAGVSKCDDLFERVFAIQPSFRAGVDYLIEAYGESYRAFAERHLEFLYSRAQDVEGEVRKAVKAFARISLEHVYLQSKLERSAEAKYLRGSFDEGLRAVYDNPDVMEGYYLDGLYLSLILWRNHYRMLRYYLDEFVPFLPPTGEFLELPTGPGSYSVYLLEALAGWRGTAVDISPSALRYARNLVDHRALGNRIQVQFGEGQKTLPWADNRFDAVVSGELIEHLDEPLGFLKECVRVTRPGGFLFITTAVYAASIDHVFMFEDVAAVNRMLEESGAAMYSYLALPVRPADGIKARVPINYAAILQKPPAA